MQHIWFRCKHRTEGDRVRALCGALDFSTVEDSDVVGQLDLTVTGIFPMRSERPLECCPDCQSAADREVAFFARLSSLQNDQFVMLAAAAVAVHLRYASYPTGPENVRCFAAKATRSDGTEVGVAIGGEYLRVAEWRQEGGPWPRVLLEEPPLLPVA